MAEVVRGEIQVTVTIEVATANSRDGKGVLSIAHGRLERHVTEPEQNRNGGAEYEIGATVLI
jgi:hypothetical protein